MSLAYVAYGVNWGVKTEYTITIHTQTKAIISKNVIFVMLGKLGIWCNMLPITRSDYA